MGNATAYRHDAAGLLTEITDPAGHALAYDEAHRTCFRATYRHPNSRVLATSRAPAQ
ncbi:MAG: RHS repeat protein [Candidatus Schekmanbacteria bacterium]|nr:RHS repeat protein [Candidatus Schekmanbacteria bacterium]